MRKSVFNQFFYVYRCWILFFASFALIPNLYSQQVAGELSAKEAMPNLLIVLADDLGYSDIGSFGAEIDTPNIDQLAQQGISFTNFHTTPVCASSRAELLTGVDMHRNGLGTMQEIIHLAPHLEGVPGYEGYLNDEVVTLGDLLSESGYSTIFSGKWHLGSGSSGGYPRDRGFQYSFALSDGGANHFSNRGVHPGAPIAHYTEDGQHTSVNEESFYSSRFYTDKVIEYIETSRPIGKPFFAVLGYTAPHWPLQAPRASIQKYEEKYKQGWDELRAQRFENMKKMGLVDESMILPDRWQGVPAWSSLSKEDRDYEAKIMAIYAAMIDDMDLEIGRLLDYLKSIDEYENTVVLFLSDNGPDSSYTVRNKSFQDWLKESGYDNRLENLGEPDSFVAYHRGWAQVSATPFFFHKGSHAEGGTRVPLIVANMPVPDVVPGHVSSDYISIRDILPTMLSLAGKKRDDFSFEHHKPAGVAIQETLQDSGSRSFAGEFMGSSFFYEDGWKLLRLGPIWGQPDWQLYNINRDPGEQFEQSGQETQKFEQLKQAYQGYADQNNVVGPAATSQ